MIAAETPWPAGLPSQTAVHEIGHAFAGWCMGYEINIVTVDAELMAALSIEAAGFTWTIGPGLDWTAITGSWAEATRIDARLHLAAECGVVYRLAGPWAKMTARRVDVADRLDCFMVDPGDRDDRLAVQTIGNAIRDPEYVALLLARCRNRLTRLFHDPVHWRVVVDAAAALDRSGTLSGDAVGRIFSDGGCFPVLDELHEFTFRVFTYAARSPRTLAVT